MTTGLDSRSAAFRLLTTVLRRRVPLDRALAEDQTWASLPDTDRAFARLLTVTSLRRLGQIDRILALALAKPLPRTAWKTMHCLRLGVTQLVFLKTPAHAAVHETVALTEKVAGDRYKSLVNAILRRLLREPELAESSLQALEAFPDWLSASWVETYGHETAANIAAAHMTEPPLDLTVKTSPQQWASQMGGEMLPGETVRLRDAGAVNALPGFESGGWWVQDFAASLPVKLLGDVRGQTVIDLCAAPGGKTAQLINAGATVIAVDRSAKRLARLKDNLQRLNMSAQMVEADATSWRPSEPADAVLLDAPCSATGTIRRHPDIPWLKAPEDISRAAQTQTRLLVAAASMVKPGGLVIYSTCSMQPEEAELSVNAVLAESGDLKREPLPPNLAGMETEWITPAGDLRTLPSFWSERGGMDGFYAARLKRVGEAAS